MRKLSMILLTVGVIALVVLITSLTANRAWADPCGPDEEGWIPGCLGQVDDFRDTTALIGIDQDGDCLEDFSLVLGGSAKVERQSASDHTIDTEIVSMELAGGGLVLRAGKYDPVINPDINQNVSPTFGGIVEQAGNPALADSFFDVFFEISPTPFGNLYNHDAVRVGAVIDRVPPWNTTYLHPTPLCLALYSDPIEDWETPVNLVQARHSTGAPPPTGGIVELLVDSSGSPARAVQGSGSSAPPYAAIAGGLAAAAVALAATGWYARRRLLS